MTDDEQARFDHLMKVSVDLRNENERLRSLVERLAPADPYCLRSDSPDEFDGCHHCDQLRYELRHRPACPWLEGAQRTGGEAVKSSCPLCHRPTMLIPSNVEPDALVLITSCDCGRPSANRSSDPLPPND